jgi:hypothetical protein
MCIKILSASVSVPGGADAVEFQFHPGINLLWGQNAEHIVRKLAGTTPIVDGSRLPDGFDSASDLLLKKLRETIDKGDDRPLFVCNFLERLDEAVDLHPIFQSLKATGRQVFIAVPHYYEINTWEELYHDTAIHTL